MPVFTPIGKRWAVGMPLWLWVFTVGPFYLIYVMCILVWWLFVGCWKITVWSYKALVYMQRTMLEGFNLIEKKKRETEPQTWAPALTEKTAHVTWNADDPSERVACTCDSPVDHVFVPPEPRPQDDPWEYPDGHGDVPSG